MAEIIIDNEPYGASEGQNLLHACLAVGLDIPYLCWHPALRSVGACRLCAVKLFKDEQDERGKIVMSCMTPVEDGMRASIQDPEARAFRAAVAEWLMLNHPHDCPVCDEGGECQLQDVTVMTGHTYRRTRFPKRTHRNQDLGPFIRHEMNRCIACYRCVRFYQELAGGVDLEALGAHHHVYFGRFEDGPLQNEFAGNLIEVCPTGVFTDKTFARHYTRKWDLQTAPSVCVHCGVGCNTIPGERYGLLRRVRSRYNREVNGCFLCDRGRFGYEFVNSKRRVRTPLSVEAGTERSLARAEGLRLAADMLRESSCVVGIGSPRASLEANFALLRLVGRESFYQGIAARQAGLLRLVCEILGGGRAPTACLDDVARSDASLVLGENVPDTAPMMAFALRQEVTELEMEIAGALHIPFWEDQAMREAALRGEAPEYARQGIQQRRRQVPARLFAATPCPTRIEDVALGVWHAAPADMARLGFAVAHAIDPAAPAPAEMDDEMRARAGEVAEMLRDGKRPVVVSGTDCGSEAVLDAATNVVLALRREGKDARIAFAVPECNSLGLGLLGGEPLQAAVERLRECEDGCAVIVESDLYCRAESQVVDGLFEAARHVIVLDHVRTRTTGRAALVLPTATFAEASGTLVSGAGRAQRFFEVFRPDGDVGAAWRWLRDMARETGRGDLQGWETLDDVVAALAESDPLLRGVREAAPAADFRLAGQKIPRQPLRYSGRAAMHADRTIHEPRTAPDADSPLSFSMEGYAGQPPAALQARFWAPAWNSEQAMVKCQQEPGGPQAPGSSGVRLFEQRDDDDGYRGRPPEAFSAADGELLALPRRYVFGSEELSAMAPAVAQMAPEPCALLNSEEAAGRDLADGGRVRIEWSGGQWTGPARADDAVPAGLVLVPFLVADGPVTGLPARARLKAQGEAGP